MSSAADRVSDCCRQATIVLNNLPVKENMIGNDVLVAFSRLKGNTKAK